MSRELCLIYRADVHVTVDLDEGTVTAVNVDDEGAVLSRNDAGLPDTDTIGDSIAARLAAASIAAHAVWPAWKLGF